MNNITLTVKIERAISELRRGGKLVVSDNNAGISVFCEKPLDLNLSRVLEVLKLVKKKRIKLMLGFNRRFDNEFFKVKQLVNQGAIGKPHLVKITSRDPKAPPINYVINSGGLFLDMTIHDFDMARFIVDKEIDEIYVKGEALIDEKTKPEDLGRPGHIFPLKAKNGGVLRRTGHTEAAVALAIIINLFKNISISIFI